MKMDRKKYLLERLIKKRNNRQVVIYGHSERNKLLRTFFQEKGIQVAFFVDRSRACRMVKDVYSPEVLENQADKYFVVVPLVKHDEIRELLVSYSYTEEDFEYLGDFPHYIIEENDSYYEDSWGNKAYGKYNKDKIKFDGFNSEVYIEDDAILEKGFELHLRDNSTFKMGNNTKANCKIILYDNCVFSCGANCVFSKSGLIELVDAKIEIGDGFTIEENYVIRALKDSSIKIGEDCMFSYNINMRTDDGHSIFDVNTGKNINSSKEEREKHIIDIRDHVWVGMNSLIMQKTKIGSGSVIGACSLVKGVVPNNCIAAGVPAKVIRKDVSWSRTKYSEDILECGVEYINKTKCDIE